MMQQAGYTGKVKIGMDVAASEFFTDDKKYDLDFKTKDEAKKDKSSIKTGYAPLPLPACASAGLPDPRPSLLNGSWHTAGLSCWSCTRTSAKTTPSSPSRTPLTRMTGTPPRPSRPRASHRYLLVPVAPATGLHESEAPACPRSRAPSALVATPWRTGAGGRR